jgi:hypothetical protein
MDKHEKNVEAAYEKLRELLATTDSKDILVRYEVGRCVADLKDESKYGPEGVEQVAARLGRGYGRSTLHRYLKVAEAWSAAAIKKIVERRNPDGFALCWSHLEYIAALDDSEDRAHFTEVTLAEGLGVRELKSAIDKKRRAADGEGELPDDGAEDPFLGSKVIPLLAEYLLEVEAQTRTWEERLLVDIGVAASDMTDDEEAVLREALERMASIGTVMKSMAHRATHLLTITRPTVRRPLLLPAAAVIPA